VQQPGAKLFLRNAYQGSGSACPHSSKMVLLEDEINTDCLLQNMIDMGDM
jgi:hypothetical protein